MDIQLPGFVAAPHRRPTDILLYPVAQDHLETFLSRGGDECWEARVPPHAKRELRRFLECGILTVLAPAFSRQSMTAMRQRRLSQRSDLSLKAPSAELGPCEHGGMEYYFSE